MLFFLSQPKQKLFSKITLMLVLFSFMVTSLGLSNAHAALTLPEPTQLLGLSAAYSFPILKGLKLNPANPLQIEFIIDSGNWDAQYVGTGLSPVRYQEALKKESEKLIRYFLAGLTIPEDDLWVNLSVYEKDRMINESAAQTDVGRDMLAQDYVLKQLVSSLTYPESETGKSYWQKTYQAAAKAFGTTDVKLDTFNKIWIAPDKAEVYEYKNTAVVNQATLKAMLEEDFVALNKNVKSVGPVESVEPVVGLKSSNRQNRLNQPNKLNQINKVASDVMREVVVPKITDDINSGKNFATLRQIYYSLILAKWFKEKFKESFYKHYINQKKIKGIDTNDPQAKEKIYNLYTQAFKKGIYDYIKKEADPATHKQVRRRYFSGGMAQLTSTVAAFPVGLDQVGSSSVTGMLTQAGVEMEGVSSSPATAAAGRAAPDVLIKNPADYICKAIVVFQKALSDRPAIREEILQNYKEDKDYAGYDINEATMYDYFFSDILLEASDRGSHKLFSIPEVNALLAKLQGLYKMSGLSMPAKMRLKARMPVAIKRFINDMEGVSRDDVKSIMSAESRLRQGVGKILRYPFGKNPINPRILIEEFNRRFEECYRWLRNDGLSHHFFYSDSPDLIVGGYDSSFAIAGLGESLDSVDDWIRKEHIRDALMSEGRSPYVALALMRDQSDAPSGEVRELLEKEDALFKIAIKSMESNEAVEFNYPMAIAVARNLDKIADETRRLAAIRIAAEWNSFYILSLLAKWARKQIAKEGGPSAKANSASPVDLTLEKLKLRRAELDSAAPYKRELAAREIFDTLSRLAFWLSSLRQEFSTLEPLSEPIGTLHFFGPETENDPTTMNENAKNKRYFALRHEIQVSESHFIDYGNFVIDKLITRLAGEREMNIKNMIINALIQLGVSPAEESNVADANALMGAWGKYQIQMLSERIPREKIIIPLHREDIEDIPVGATSISYAVVDDDKAIGAIEEEIARIKIAYGLVSPALGKNTPVPEIAYQPQAHSIIEQSDISQRQNPGAPRAHAEEEGTNWVLGLTHSDIGTIADRLTKFFWKSPEGCPQLPQSVTAQNFHDALAAYMERMIESRKGPAQHLAEYGIHLSRGMFFRHLPQGDGLTITSALSEHSYFSVTYVFRENGTMSPPATAVVKMPATIVSSAMPGKKDIKKNAASPAGKKTVGRDAAGRGTMEGISASPTGDGDKASLPADPEKAKKIILVVDDDYDFRTSLVEYLRGSLNEDDIEIVTAGNKKEALQILAGNQHIKFVLSDTRMPRPNDGFELAGTVRERYPGLPFYLMSSYIANEHREAEAAGKIDGFISKLRVGDTAFLEMIKKHLVSSSPSDFGTAEIGTNKLFSPEGEKNLGGIKMSGIPVISSPTSQKIEFAAIGPDFFERLTFRIVSMKHIASLAQFASVP